MQASGTVDASVGYILAVKDVTLLSKVSLTCPDCSCRWGTLDTPSKHTQHVLGLPQQQRLVMPAGTDPVRRLRPSNLQCPVHVCEYASLAGRSCRCGGGASHPIRDSLPSWTIPYLRIRKGATSDQPCQQYLGAVAGRSTRDVASHSSI
jgi:hypothetical protein